MERFGMKIPQNPTPRLVGVFEAPKAQFASGSHKVWLYKKCLRVREGLKPPVDLPFEDIVNVSLMEGSELESRLTLTRIAIAGPFAWALKKKKGGEKFLTIETEDTAHVVEVGRKKVAEATKLVALLKPLVAGKQVED